MPIQYSRPIIYLPHSPSIALVELTQDQFAVIDADDADRVGDHNWFAQWTPSTRHFYAKRRIVRKTGKGIGAQSLQEFVFGELEGFTVDHIVLGNGLDCRKVNLRFGDSTDQARHRRLRSDNASGFKGVHLRRSTGRWIATIRIKGVLTYLGDFVTKEEAAWAYREAATKHYGDFAHVE